MANINKSTTDVIAAITAQNLFRRSPYQATSVTAVGVSESTMPISSAEQKEKKPRKEVWTCRASVPLQMLTNAAFAPKAN